MASIRTIVVAVLVAAGALLSAGCSQQPYVTGPRLERGLVMVYTGIEGRGPFNDSICDALADSGVPHAIELVDWTVGIPGAYLVNLRYEGRNRKVAEELAARIGNYRMRYPGRPVVLLGQSGGAAMAAWTAEAMPRREQVDGIIMLAAALSPEYMLDEALAHSREGIVNFHSRADVVFLWMGTAVWGTMDGRHGSSAGRVGFIRAGGVVPDIYREKLFQVPWTSAMASGGHWGGHISTSAGGFLRRFVAPLVTAPRWDHETVARLTCGKPGRMPDCRAEPPGTTRTD